MLHKTKVEPLATGTDFSGQAAQIDALIERAMIDIATEKAVRPGALRLQGVSVNVVVVPGEPTLVIVSILAEDRAARANEDATEARRIAAAPFAPAVGGSRGPFRAPGERPPPGPPPR